MRRLLVLCALVFAAAPLAAHDVHVSYGRLAVEGRAAVLQLRFFQDDLEAALRAFHRLPPSYRLTGAPADTRRFEAYLNARLRLSFGGRTLTGRVVSAGVDPAGHDPNGGPMWVAEAVYEARAPITGFALRHTLLFEAFPTQQNLVKVMFFPSERVETLYFTAGAEQHRVTA